MSYLPFFIRYFIYLLLCFVFVGPMSALIHEMGHACLALLLTDRNVAIQLGQHGKRFSCQFGRLKIIYFMEFGANYGIYYLEKNNGARISLSRMIWIRLGGPITSLLMFTVFGSLTAWTKFSVPLFVLFAFVNLLHLIFSTIPWQYPEWTGAMAGLPNDGLSAWRIIKRSNHNH